MAQGVAGTCVCCDLASDKRLEIDARIVRGDTLDSIAEVAGCNYMTVKRHLDLGHVADITRIREWMQKHGGKPSRALEIARTKALENPEKITQEQLNATLLSLAQHGMRLLTKMEADEDYRGSVAAIESLRRTAMDLATLNSLKGNEQKEPVESTDVALLRQSILDAIGRGKGELPQTYEWRK